jgi:hypothetical protein
MGYSGDPARDLADGSTVAGPVYGDQYRHLSASHLGRLIADYTADWKW